MHLHAAFIPPAAVREALAALITAQEPAVDSAATGRRGLFGRRTPSEAGPGTPMLEPLDPDAITVPITDFGYVASGDARRLVDVLTAVCAAQPGDLEVSVSGGAALIDDDDRSVWADLAGSEVELSVMRAIALSVVSAVEPLGFFRDRRQYRSRFPIATITDATTAEHLEKVLAAMAAYTSEPWTIDQITILKRGEGVWRTLPVGG